MWLAPEPTLRRGLCSYSRNGRLTGHQGDPRYTPRRLCKRGKGWVSLGTAIPFPTLTRQASFCYHPSPFLTSCFYQPGRRGQASGSQGPPRTAARPSQASLASETAALPWRSGVFPSLQLEQHPSSVRDQTTPPKLASPSQKRHSLGTGAKRQGCPLKVG